MTYVKIWVRSCARYSKS